MAAVITDPNLESRLRAERKLSGADRFDEVWEGIYLISPLADIEHQRLQFRLATAFQLLLGAQSPAIILAGVNVSDRELQWEHNYRCPDVAVFLPGNSAKNCGTHFFGGPDLAVEIVSPYDRSREKTEFYAAVGVRELLLIDRNPWSIELYRLQAGALALAAKCASSGHGEVQSSVLPMKLHFSTAAMPPKIVVARKDAPDHWIV
jgi:Uma2 family endonuclease